MSRSVWRWSTVRVGFATCLVLGTLAGCSHKSDAIWIGVVAMLNDVDGSERNLRGVRVAVDEANAAGGIQGRQVEIRILRDSGLGETAVRVAQAFVTDNRIVAVLGHEFSSAMLAAAPLYDGNLAAVSTASSPLLTGISPWVFRVVTSDSVLGTDEARLFAARGWRRIAILYVNDVYGRGLVGSFIPAFRARGGEVVSRNPIPDNASDFQVYFRAFDNSLPDAVFVICGPSEAASFLRAAAKHHLRAQVIGGDGWGESLEKNPAAAEGVVWPASYAASDTQPAAVEFRRVYFARYNEQPDAVSALAHDAAQSVLEAIRRGGATRAGVRSALAAPGLLVTGTTGPIAFQHGERVGGVGGLMRMVHGRLTMDQRWDEVRRP
ncbi:MAG: ABC transporter substrate-binding protein [bacterium]